MRSRARARAVRQEVPVSRLGCARSQRVAVELDRMELLRRLPQASRRVGSPSAIASVRGRSLACVSSGCSFACVSVPVCRLQVPEDAV